ncbi:MAG: hypothetical protein CNCCGFBP_00063 [Fimbriimonadaceae bacterium]|nr:hypothetical protein [Fimbriimonadaceae bacterium]
MAIRDALVPEDLANLEHLRQIAADQPLQIEFERDAELDVDIVRVVMRQKRARRRSTRHDLEHWSLDLDVPLLFKVLADGRHDLTASDELVSNWLVGDEVQVPMPVARLDVFESVPLLTALLLADRQGVEALTEWLEFTDMNRPLAGAGSKQRAIHAHMVADVEQGVRLPRLLAEVILAEVRLELAVSIRKMGESRLAHQPIAYDPAGKRDVRCLGFGKIPLGRKQLQKIVGRAC